MLVKKTTHAVSLVALVILSMTSTIVLAQQSGQRRGPPPEAIEACANLEEEAACSFSGPRGDATGQCRSAPDNQEMLACMPAGGPPPK